MVCFQCWVGTQTFGDAGYGVGGSEREAGGGEVAPGIGHGRGVGGAGVAVFSQN